jgi:hypothetical protein
MIWVIKPKAPYLEKKKTQFSINQILKDKIKKNIYKRIQKTKEQLKEWGWKLKRKINLPKGPKKSKKWESRLI